MPESDIERDVLRAIAVAKRALLASFFEAPAELFTELDVTSVFAHHLYRAMDAAGLPRLVHLQYPTPFLCGVTGGAFEARPDGWLVLDNRRFRRGFFDVAVLHPAFAREFAHEFRVAKGQSWSALGQVLRTRDAESPPAALAVFELMYVRDPAWSDSSFEGRAATMQDIATAAQLDLDKAMHACVAAAEGFRFAGDARMMVFDNGLDLEAALALHELLDPRIELYSAALGPLPSDEDPRGWADLDRAARTSAATLQATDVPAGPGVYAWFRDGVRVYVGKAASLRRRLVHDHLGRGTNVRGSSLRRNVAASSAFASAAALKSGAAKLTATQHADVRAWLESCEVAWLPCDSAAHALALETKLKAEHTPPLTKR